MANVAANGANLSKTVCSSLEHNNRIVFLPFSRHSLRAFFFFFDLQKRDFGNVPSGVCIAKMLKVGLGLRLAKIAKMLKVCNPAM